MNEYEVTTVLPTDISVEQAKKVVLDILGRGNAKVGKVDDWGVRKLPHPIGKAESGHFVCHAVTLDPAKVADVRREFEIEQTVLRYMVKRTA